MLYFRFGYPLPEVKPAARLKGGTLSRTSQRHATCRTALVGSLSGIRATWSNRERRRWRITSKCDLDPLDIVDPGECHLNSDQ